MNQWLENIRKLALQLQNQKVESPYVVIKKVLGKVYALQCTSNPHHEIKWKMAYYPLGKLNYEMKKNSFINCMVVYELKEIQFVEMIGRLSDVDLNQLKKQLYILKNSDFKVKPDIEKKYLDFKIGVGDVILYNGDRYYIDSIKGRSYETYSNAIFEEGMACLKRKE